jgi:hypothetical protein
MNDIKTKIEEVRQELAPYADRVVDRAVAWIVAHPKTTLAILSVLVIAFFLATRI